jgi:hypothetical protein
MVLWIYNIIGNGITKFYFKFSKNWPAPFSLKLQEPILFKTKINLEFSGSIHNYVLT